METDRALIFQLHLAQTPKCFCYLNNISFLQSSRQRSKPGVLHMTQQDENAVGHLEKLIFALN